MRMQKPSMQSYKNPSEQYINARNRKKICWKAILKLNRVPNFVTVFSIECVV